MKGKYREDTPPHKIKVIWIDPKRASHIYENVDHFYPNRLIWIIQFMNGSRMAIRFDLVLCIEILEPVEELDKINPEMLKAFATDE